MSRIVSRAEAFETVYEAFNQINFNAFDYNTIKQSLIDYLKLYYPEDFNDFIETSEFIAMMELFAYVGELIAYRVDINAHENFITQAQRKESILRLAKLISYSASRNIPARGLVKMTSITSTEQITDSNGVNLANTKINWNDANNSNWKDQFFLIINKVLRQDFGTVSPTERVQVDDVLFELYQVENNPIPNGVFAYSASVSGQSVGMELVPTTLTDNGPEERRPDNVSTFTMLYGQDGLGDGSDTTGFFFFTKQGSLAKETSAFDGVTPNQTYEIDIDNINETDIWVNNIDPDTGETLDDGTVAGAISGEWIEVDLANAQNIIFNTNERRQKYEIETLANDQVRFIFGDSEFADVPNGTFDLWFRTSLNEDIVIPQNSVINKAASFTYNDDRGNVQTLSFTFSLIGSLQNASPTETLDHVRRVAPSVYFTQDRMVNNRDYNVFMLQDPSILKLRSLNRTFAGDSKYLYWHDPSETYEHVKLFGCDLYLYVEDSDIFVDVTTSSISDLIDNFIEPILSTTDFFTILTTHGVSASSLRKRFTSQERTALFNALTDIINGFASTDLHVYYHPDASEFQFQTGSSSAVTPNPVTGSSVSLVDTIWTSSTGVIEVELTGTESWRVNWKRERIVTQSDDMRFWNTNNGNTSIDYDTLNTVNDRITIFDCNLNSSWGRFDFSDPTSQAILSSSQVFNVLNQELTVDELRDIHRLNVLPTDVDNDNIADNMDLSDLLDGDLYYPAANEITLPFSVLYNDFVSGVISVEGDVSGTLTIYNCGSPTVGDFYLADSPGGSCVSSGEAGNTLVFINGSPSPDTQFILHNKDFIYFFRDSTSNDWEIVTTTNTVIESWYAEVALIGSPETGDYPDNDPTGQYRRLRGRGEFNFAWFHSADSFYLIDPAQTNIIDMFIFTRGYNINVQDWLNGELTVEPEPPTPLELRTSYANLLDNKMISDTVVLHSGKFKILFGSKAIPELQAKLKVIRPATSILTDNQVKTQIVSTVQTFFDVNVWEFGETFFFTELAAVIHNSLQAEIDSVVLVPQSANHQFGDLFQVLAREDEIFQADIGVEDIEIVQSYTAINLRQDI